MAASVPISATGMVSAGMSVARQSLRKQEQNHENDHRRERQCEFNFVQGALNKDRDRRCSPRSWSPRQDIQKVIDA